MGEEGGEECLVPAGGVGEFGGPLQFCYLFPAGWYVWCTVCNWVGFVYGGGGWVRSGI